MAEVESDGASISIQRRYPREVDENGNFLSYIRLESANSEEKLVRRSKRSVTDFLTSREDGHEIFIEMDEVFDMPKARFHLKKNYRLVSKNFQLEVRGRGGKIIKIHNEVDDCHYTGTIHNYEGYSKVALSLCEGLVRCAVDNSRQHIISS